MAISGDLVQTTHSHSRQESSYLLMFPENYITNSLICYVIDNIIILRYIMFMKVDTTITYNIT